MRYFLIALYLVSAIALGSFVQQKRSETVSELSSRWLPGFPLASSGPFRGVLVAGWWMRIQRLRSEFQFEKIASVIKRISFLQPHIPEVWEYLSWNMAYNLLADTQYDRKLQTKWLRRGLDHLEEGLIYNPDSLVILFAQARTVYMKATTEYDFKKELEEILGEKPFSYALRKVIESGVMTRGGYSEHLLAIDICRKADDYTMAHEGARLLLERFPKKRNNSQQLLKEAGLL